MNQTVSPILLLQKQRALLQMEYDAEKEEFRRQTETLGVRRKVKRGDCWLPLRIGRSYYNSLNQLVVEVFRTADTDVEHNFEFGRQVMFFHIDANDEIRYFSFSATVSYAEAERMVVAIPDSGCVAQLQGANQVGVQLSFDETTYRLMMDALERVMRAKGNRLAHLRDIFYNPSKTEKFTFAPMRFPWLNPTQEHAVNEVLLAKDVAIVHGPPGTGKTTTLVEAIFETLRRENQVMVCAQSNMAVDWISERLVDRGVEVLRIGNPTKVNDKMLSFTYERRFESHPDYPDLWQVRRSIRQLYSLPRKGRGENFHQKIARLRERADELEMRIRHALFDQSRVIACTLTGAANQLLAGQHYHTLFIDEAAQALEAACWIPLQKADRVILAGDHQQLPPTVKCAEAMRGGLGRTLMEQVAHCKPEVVRLLRVQYRMNEALMRFSSEWFYHGQLEAAPEVRNRSLLDYIDDPLVWVDTDQAHLEGEAVPEADNEGVVLNHEQFVGSSYGRINKREAELTMQTLKAYVERMGRHRLLEERVDFGIISPYRAQVQYLRGLIKRDAYLRPLRAQITVNTVDAFQGQERDVVMVSLVRANEAGQIGFLSDLRRMNVAITRARYKLVILGSAQTLCKHTFYKKLFDSCQHV